MIRSIGFGRLPRLIRNITFIRIRCCLINFRDLRLFVQIFIHSGGDHNIGGDQSYDRRFAGSDEQIYGPADTDVTTPVLLTVATPVFDEAQVYVIVPVPVA